MNSLFAQLGINGKLFLAQGFNFLVVLFVLTIFVYRPLLKLLEERRKKIEFGLRGAEEAERRLRKADEEGVKKIKEADKSAMQIIGVAEESARKRSEEIVAVAEKKAGSIVEAAALVGEHKKQEELRRLADGARAIVKEAISKAVELDPASIDEKLVSRAVEIIRKKVI